VTTHLIENYLDVGDSDGNLAPLYEAAEERAASQTESLIDELKDLPSLSPDQITGIETRVRERQKELGYADYDSWIAKVTPPDLE
jgi:hypothetical protein